MSEYQDILDFWFEEVDRLQWFSQKNDEFDQLVKGRFLEQYQQAHNGRYDHWAEEAEGCLALCILLDQFPRQMFRGTGNAFATDEKILGIVKEAIEKGLDQQLEPIKRRFFYLPFEHSEKLENQKRSVELFAAMKEDDPEGYDYALRHLEIIERFGHFPQRNKALGREITEEQQNYLEGLAQAGRNY